MTEQIKKACAKASALRHLLKFISQSLRGAGRGFLATFLIGKWEENRTNRNP